jgi:hypothetical protein
MQATMQKAALDGKIKSAKAKQAMSHKQQGFLLDQKRKDAALIGDMRRKSAKRFSALEPL